MAWSSSDGARDQNLNVGTCAANHALDVRAIPGRHETGEADPLDARIASRHLEPFDVRAELVELDRVLAANSPDAAVEHGDVRVQPRVDLGGHPRSRGARNLSSSCCRDLVVGIASGARR